MSYHFRHSFNRWPADRVNKHLLQAITVRSIEREKRDHVNLVTLRFKRSQMERRVSQVLIKDSHLYNRGLLSWVYRIYIERERDREKRDHVNLVTLRFKRSQMERRVSQVFKDSQLYKHNHGLL